MKLRVLTLIVSLLLLAGCSSSGSYDDGFENGYDEGYSDAYLKHEEDYARGYSDGYREGRSEPFFEGGDLSYQIESAYDYARDMTGWSVYEAWNNIMIYNDGGENDGFTVSYQEYIESVETLVYFCERMDSIDIYE